MPVINHFMSQFSISLICNSLLKTWKMIVHMILIIVLTTVGVESVMDYEMVEEFGDDFTIAIKPARFLWCISLRFL